MVLVSCVVIKKEDKRIIQENNLTKMWKLPPLQRFKCPQPISEQKWIKDTPLETT